MRIVMKSSRKRKREESTSKTAQQLIQFNMLRVLKEHLVLTARDLVDLFVTFPNFFGLTPEMIEIQKNRFIQLNAQAQSIFPNALYRNPFPLMSQKTKNALHEHNQILANLSIKPDAKQSVSDAKYSSSFQNTQTSMTSLEKELVDLVQNNSKLMIDARNMALLLITFPNFFGLTPELVLPVKTMYEAYQTYIKMYSPDAAYGNPFPGMTEQVKLSLHTLNSQLAAEMFQPTPLHSATNACAYSSSTAVTLSILSSENTQDTKFTPISTSSSPISIASSSVDTVVVDNTDPPSPLFDDAFFERYQGTLKDLNRSPPPYDLSNSAIHADDAWTREKLFSALSPK